MTAPLYFRYGGYSHQPGEVTFESISTSVEFTSRGQKLLRKQVWQIKGVLIATDIDDLTVKLINLERAYDKQGQNAGLYEVGGGATAHVLTTNDALGGVRSMGVSYPDGGGVEYVNSRTYTITLEADYPYDNTTLLEFQETVTFTGTGGPKFVFLPVINGPPEKQIVLQATTCQATQSGSAVGHNTYPGVPAPLFPSDEIVGERRINRTSPINILGSKRQFGIQWSYSFESATPFTGLPNSL